MPNYYNKRLVKSGSFVTGGQTTISKILHECDVLIKRFTQSGTLEEHRRTYIREKRHECDICKIKFAQSAQLFLNCLSVTYFMPRKNRFYKNLSARYIKEC